MPLSAVVNTYAGNPLDRASDRRSDAGWIAERLAQPDASAIALWNGQPLIEASGRGERLVYLAAAAASGLAGAEDRLLFLGLEDGRPLFAADLEGADDPSQGVLMDLGRFENLRALASRLKPAEAAIAATAKAVFEWRRRHGFCSACGRRSDVADAGWKANLPRLQGGALPAHRSGGDHAAGPGRTVPARAPGGLAGRNVLSPRRLP